jgi:hypothetical protein
LSNLSFIKNRKKKAVKFYIPFSSGVNKLKQNRKNSQFLIDLLLSVESYQTPYAEAVGDPDEILIPLIREYCIKITTLSVAVHFAPSPISEILILPEVWGVLQLQSRMVKDIAAVYGKERSLCKDILLYCLFKRHKTNLWERTIKMCGTRVLIRSISSRSYLEIFEKLASEKKGLSHNSKWFTLLGMITSGIIGYSDTRMVGLTAMEVFSREIEWEEVKEMV